MIYGAMNFPVIPVVEEIHSFAGLGFDYLELAMDPPEAHYSIVSENRLAITKALAELGMGIVCHLPTFVSAADLTESMRRASVTEMKQSLSVAADLGAEKAVLHPPMLSGMGAYVPERVRGYALEFIAEMLEMSEALGVTICLENMMPRNGFGVEPAELDMLFWRFPNLRFTLDTGHANLGEGGGNRLAELVERFGERLGHVHLSDNRGVYDDHFPLGSGTIDFRLLARSLKKIGYDGTVTFEVFDEDRHLLAQSRDLWGELIG
ncbi:MAG: sugar phosphate isomerase/epimerase [Desulfofustis sp.]|nr:sugar phosphate isomerase/epimerase [Desulfofustis sp.]